MEKKIKKEDLRDERIEMSDAPSFLLAAQGGGITLTSKPLRDSNLSVWGRVTLPRFCVLRSARKQQIGIRRVVHKAPEGFHRAV